MAYQVQPDLATARKLGMPEDFLRQMSEEDEPYTWEHIRHLNLVNMGIVVPNYQVMLTCPIEQIPQRRAYRQKQGVGTSGQMSGGREEIIYDALLQIHEWLLHSRIPSLMVENEGVPVEDVEAQIRQAIPVYLKIEAALRDAIRSRIVGGFHNFRLAPDPLTQQEAERFFLAPENLRSIYHRQCVGRVREELWKEI